jgi:hypothetical protein
MSPKYSCKRPFQVAGVVLLVEQAAEGQDFVVERLVEDAAAELGEQVYHLLGRKPRRRVVALDRAEVRTRQDAPGARTGNEVKVVNQPAFGSSAPFAEFFFEHGQDLARDDGPDAAAVNGQDAPDFRSRGHRELRKGTSKRPRCNNF